MDLNTPISQFIHFKLLHPQKLIPKHHLRQIHNRYSKTINTLKQDISTKKLLLGKKRQQCVSLSSKHLQMKQKIQALQNQIKGISASIDELNHSFSQITRSSSNIQIQNLLCQKNNSIQSHQQSYHNYQNLIQKQHQSKKDLISRINEKKLKLKQQPSKNLLIQTKTNQIQQLKLTIKHIKQNNQQLKTTKSELFQKQKLRLNTIRKNQEQQQQNLIKKLNDFLNKIQKSIQNGQSIQHFKPLLNDKHNNNQRIQAQKIMSKKIKIKSLEYQKRQINTKLDTNQLQIQEKIKKLISEQQKVQLDVIQLKQRIKQMEDNILTFTNK